MEGALEAGVAGAPRCHERMFASGIGFCEPSMRAPDQVAASKPTSKQLNYLRSLAQPTGQTFAWPQTIEDASNEIERLQGVKKTPPADGRRERREVRDDMPPGARSARVRDRGRGLRQHGPVGGPGGDGLMTNATKPIVGQRIGLGRYTISAGDRVLYGQRVDGVVRVTDKPLGTGRSFLVERGLTSNAELQALVAGHVDQSERRDEPAAVVRIGNQPADRLSGSHCCRPCLVHRPWALRRCEFRSQPISRRDDPTGRGTTAATSKVRSDHAGANGEPGAREPTSTRLSSSDRWSAGERSASPSSSAAAMCDLCDVPRPGPDRPRRSAAPAITMAPSASTSLGPIGEPSASMRSEIPPGALALTPASRNGTAPATAGSASSAPLGRRVAPSAMAAARRASAVSAHA